MHRLAWLTGTVLFCAFALPVHAESGGSPRAQVVRRVMQSSVRVQVFAEGELERSATGVVVHGQGAGVPPASGAYVLTNAHVADPSELKDVTYKVLLETHGRVVKTLTAKLTALGHVPELDLALLHVDEALPAADLGAEDTVDVGDEVVVVGAPYGRALSVSGGLVSQLEAEEKTTSLRYSGMKTDAPIGYGSSGGGVFGVPSGQLLGLVEGYRTARVNIDERRSFDVPMPGETFVTPVTKVRAFLVEHLEPKAKPGVPAAVTAPVARSAAIAPH